MKNKIAVVLLISLLFSLYFIFDFFNSKKESKIEEYGNYFFSVVDRKIPLGNQGSNRLKHYLHMEDKKYHLTNYIAVDYYSEIEVGDTILIKAIISDTLIGSILQEDKRHLIPCLIEYKQPPNGWRQLPINKCHMVQKNAY